MFICKKTGRVFNSHRGLLNHLGFVYDDIKNAYLSENNIEPPLCSYCGKNESKFISFLKGFNDVCYSKDCKRQKSIIVNRGIARKKKENNKKISQGFANFICNNIDFYKENLHKSNIIDIFTKKNIGNITLNQFIHRYVNKQQMNVTKICKYCDKEFKISILNNRSNCGSKRCRSLCSVGYMVYNDTIIDPKEINNRYHKFMISGMSHYSSKKEIKKYLKDSDHLKYIFGFLASKIKGYWRCPVNDLIIPLVNKQSILIEYLNKMEINVEDYYRRYLPDFIRFCKNCGSLVVISKDLNVKPKTKFCSNKCYAEYMISHKEEYKRSDERREKQSQLMISLISSGSFIPKINNVYNGSLLSYNGKKYRSSWDLAFHILNPYLLYESKVIQYNSPKDNKEHNYIVDFEDNKKKILYEIKPEVNTNNPINKAKEKAVIKWCKNNKYQYILITDNYFYDKLTADVIKDWNPELKRRLLQFI